MGKKFVSTEERIQFMEEEPKKAIIRLAIPVIISNLAVLLYNLIDGIWVSGLGTDSLAGVGAFLPFSILLTGLFSGFENAGVSFLSQFVSNKDEFRRWGSLLSFFYLILLSLIVLTFILLKDKIFALMGISGEIYIKASKYSLIMLFGFFLIIFNTLASTIFRSEGLTKAIGYVGIIGAVINAILDPIFIYILNLGFEGAAWATVCSITAGILIYSYFFIGKKESLMKFIFLKGVFLKKKSKVMLNLLSLGIYLSLSQLAFSLLIFSNNTLITNLYGETGITVYNIGLRWMGIAIVPLIGISSVLISLIGITYGKKDYEKMNSLFNYSVKISVVIEITLAVITFVFAPQIAYLFSYTDKSGTLQNEFVLFFRIMSSFLPAHAVSVLASACFAGMGKGKWALFLNLLRTMLFVFPMVLLFTYVIPIGLTGVWTGIAAGNLCTAAVALVMFKKLYRKLMLLNTQVDLVK